jgi:hypothetical protein
MLSKIVLKLDSVSPTRQLSTSNSLILVLLVKIQPVDERQLIVSISWFE